MKKLTHFAVSIAAAALVLSGCAANTDSASKTGAQSGGDGASFTVDITDDTCAVSGATMEAGKATFTLNNKGESLNEFEILAEDKLQIVGERENLGPGTTTEYTLVLQPGTYYTACKKNMVGALVGLAEFTVTGEAVELAGSDKELMDKAVADYTAYVRDQAGQLLAATEAWAEAYKKGDAAAAKDQYAKARQYYERIEPTAEAFGDIDPALDEREADYQEAMETEEAREWTGWHVAEKDLWFDSQATWLSGAQPGYAQPDQEQRAKIADGIVATTKKLYDLVYSDDFSVSLDDISNGAIGLLEEVATTKITGEEEAFSRTDLWDFKANLEGAKVAYGIVKAIAEKNDAKLAAEIDEQIEVLEAELAQYAVGEGYKYYNELSEEQVKALSDKVNALRLPLARLTESVLGIAPAAGEE